MGKDSSAKDPTQTGIDCVAQTTGCGSKGRRSPAVDGIAAAFTLSRAQLPHRLRRVVIAPPHSNPRILHANNLNSKRKLKLKLRSRGEIPMATVVFSAPASCSRAAAASACHEPLAPRRPPSSVLGSLPSATFATFISSSPLGSPLLGACWFASGMMVDLDSISSLVEGVSLCV